MYTPFSTEALATFAQTIVIMIEGMGGIFVFMLIFYGLITLLDYLYKESNGCEL